MQLVGSQIASFTGIIPNLEMLQGTEWGASWKYYSIIVRISCDTALRGGASARSQVGKCLAPPGRPQTPVEWTGSGGIGRAAGGSVNLPHGPQVTY